jgi:hypothetical protein
MSYRVRHEERPWTANAGGRGTTPGARRAHAAKIAAWRRTFELLARAEGVPALGPCEVVVRVYYPNRRSLPDVGSCFPAYKAAQDGLVDAGVFPDDRVEWVRRLVFEAPVIGQGGPAMELELRPLDNHLEAA